MTLTVKAVSAKKFGCPNVAGLDNVTFSPARKANLFAYDNTLLIFLPLNDGNGLVVSSPVSRSAHVNFLTKNITGLLPLIVCLCIT